MLQNSRIAGLVPSTVVLLATVAAACGQSATPPAGSNQKLFAQFDKKAKQYMDTEHSLAADKMKPTDDVAKLQNQRRKLREAVQQARPKAKQGDFFSPDIAPEFRRVLGQLLRGPDGAKIRTSLQHAEPGAPATFKVNAEFPNQNGQPIQSVPPTVLKVLPVLPKGLEYCIAGSTLALRDTAANLVVDFLPNALP